MLRKAAVHRSVNIFVANKFIVPELAFLAKVANIQAGKIATQSLRYLQQIEKMKKIFIIPVVCLGLFSCGQAKTNRQTTKVIWK